jgi:predicted nucleic acid-binding protein
MIILDTNVVSEAMKLQMSTAVQLWLDGQVASDLFLTATSLAELRLGIEILPPGRRRTFLAGTLERILDHVFGDQVLAFDASAARAYGEIVSRVRQKGRAISTADGQIAAIAHVYGYKVATRDTKPFEAAGVAVINPWVS